MADIRQISQMLRDRAESVAQYLLPSGKKKGSEWKSGSIYGDAGESLGVHLKGAKAGIWCDFATGESGDLLDLWKTVRAISLAEAFQQAKGWLGVVEPQFEPKASERKKYRKPTVSGDITKLDPEGEVWRYLTETRKLTETSLSAFRLAQRFDDRCGWQIVFPYRRERELINIKYLDLERDEKGKKRMRSESDCELCLFGWQALSADTRELIICEGELDALSWYEYGYSCLSLPNGVKGTSWLEGDFHLLERFETIYISLDADDEGQKGISNLVERLGRYRCRVVNLPDGVKDCNEALQNGVTVEQMAEAIFFAESQDPSELKNASTFVDQVIEEFYPVGGVEPGFMLQWETMKHRLRFRPGETTIWTGYNGHGKSLVLSQILLAGAEQNERACVASMEMPARKWLKRMTRQATIEERPSVDLIRASHHWFGDWLWIFNVTGTAKASRLKEVFLYARQRYGVTQFIIDSLMKCGFAEDDYTGQKLFIEEMTDFALEHNVHLHIVAHSRKGDNEQQMRGKLDVKGTGAISDLAWNVLSIWRNKKKEEEIERAEMQGYYPDEKILEQPDGMLICDKQRNGEWEGRLPVWFHKTSMQYVDNRDGHPYRFIDYLSSNDTFSADDESEVI